ncbi:MAG: hypothetical protein H0W68_02690 [Gemmatimonadaceae bacterium]|nr:hypothetical protein [Gemmatimonadaceae bacterium]
MNEYRIEKVRHPAAVALTNGRLLEGDMFLQRFAQFRAGPEQPLDVLNNNDPFLPMMLSSGDVRLLQKSQITMVATALPALEDGVVTTVPGMHIELTLSDDTSLEGSVFPELRSDHPRLVDFLNCMTSRFFPVFGTEQLLLVSYAHIVSARPVY